MSQRRLKVVHRESPKLATCNIGRNNNSYSTDAECPEIDSNMPHLQPYPLIMPESEASNV